MEKNASWIVILAFIFIIPFFFLAISNPVPPRVFDHEQFEREEHIVIKFSHVVDEMTPKGQAALRFAELAHKRTGGRVEVQVYPNSQLYMDGEEVEALQNNNVQIIAPATAKMAEYFPYLLLFDLPFLFDSYEAVHNFIDSPTGQEIIERSRGENMLALNMWDNGFKHMIGNQPFFRPSQFNGTRIRMMPFSEVLKKQFEKLGAEPVAMRFSEVFQAKQNGTIDGSENTPSNIYSQRFHRVHEYITLSNHGYLGYIVLTNEEFWTELPDDIKEILEETMEEVTLWEREQAIKFNRRDLTRIINTPEVKVGYLSNTDQLYWEQLLLPLYDEFIDVYGEEYLNNAIRKNEKTATGVAQ